MTFLPGTDLLTFDEIVRVARVARSARRDARCGSPAGSRWCGGASSSWSAGWPRRVRRLRPDHQRHAAGAPGRRRSPRPASPGSTSAATPSGRSDSPPSGGGATWRPSSAAMDAAEAAGLAPVKVNVVLLAGMQRRRDPGLRRLRRATGRVVRFIEFMPLDAAGRWGRDQVVPGDEVLRAHRRALAARARSSTARGPRAGRAVPVRRRAGEIGVISSVTQPFCGTCNRLRLTADGAVRNCLFSDDEIAVRDLLRAGGDRRDDRYARCAARSGGSSRATASTTRGSSGPAARCR